MIQRAGRVPDCDAVIIVGDCHLLTKSSKLKQEK